MSIVGGLMVLFPAHLSLCIIVIVSNQEEPQTVVHPDTQASSGEGVFCFLPIIQFYHLVLPAFVFKTI